MGSKGGRPKATVNDVQRERARELFSASPCRSRTAAQLMREFSIGRPHAYKALDAALEEFRTELAGRGLVDPLLVSYVALVGVLTNDSAKPRDKTAAAVGLVRLTGVKAFKDLADAGDVDAYLREVLERRAARLALAPPVAPIPTEPTT